MQQVVDRGVAADAVLIPFGGGSNIAGSLQAPEDETRPVICLDLGRMNRLLDVDEESGLARIQAGALGPDIEAQLNARGWTLGHFPDSFTHCTLGGWVATRSSGMQSDKYGDIADITRGLRMVMPGRVLVLRAAAQHLHRAQRPRDGPRLRGPARRHHRGDRAGAPDPRGAADPRLPVPLLRGRPGRDARDLRPATPRRRSPASPTPGDPLLLRHPEEVQGRLGRLGLVSKGLFKVLERRGWHLDAVCLSFIGYEGGQYHVSRQKAIVKKIVGKHGGIVLGKGPGVLYDQKKFDTPYIRDFLLDRGAAGRRVRDRGALVEAGADLRQRHGRGRPQGVRRDRRPGLDHVPPVALLPLRRLPVLHLRLPARRQDPLAQYDVVKSAIQQAFVDSDGTLSHHHGVGTEHAPWLEQDISARRRAHDRRACSPAIDPGRNFNPGKIIVK